LLTRATDDDEPTLDKNFSTGCISLCGQEICCGRGVKKTSKRSNFVKRADFQKDVAGMSQQQLGQYVMDRTGHEKGADVNFVLDSWMFGNLATPQSEI
jgi:hypothetical protein